MGRIGQPALLAVSVGSQQFGKQRSKDANGSQQGWGGGVAAAVRRVTASPQPTIFLGDPTLNTLTIWVVIHVGSGGASVPSMKYIRKMSCDASPYHDLCEGIRHPDRDTRHIPPIGVYDLVCTIRTEKVRGAPQACGWCHHHRCCAPSGKRVAFAGQHQQEWKRGGTILFPFGAGKENYVQWNAASPLLRARATCVAWEGCGVRVTAPLFVQTADCLIVLELPRGGTWRETAGEGGG